MIKQHNLDPVGPATDQWIERIYLDEYPGLKGLAYKFIRNELEAEHIVERSFDKLEKKINDSPDYFASITHAKAYLANIIRNASIDFIKDHPGHQAFEEADDEQIADVSSAIEMFEAADLQRRLPKYIDQLPEAWRQVMLLFFVEGLSMEEVKQRLGKTNNDIRVLKSKALKRLRQLLLGEDGAGLPGEVLFFLLWVSTVV
ncbi:sigma-70 family RNA polymerase sigma factor [Paraflavitalea sp. CAU 1676]|uniref:RNA polymerase sigma factor n=1 Tax=Paraflavitalea sp. CAU 1676 TaxID=3032598 RepID=UPI0023DB39CB|nr:sigma-70 family RNA polymerase sigma factor [Paraflavitalea sp. CAU 1676]MDF2192592.1 sigma-70 family RNA polymerase sigma factor [Paraflavitalea sp. CAU 1676]